MAQYIDKSALVAEIKNRLHANGAFDEVGDEAWAEDVGMCNAYKSILSFLDTLEVKEMDLEKETKKWWKEHLHLDPKNQLWMDAHQSIVFAEHFFELGMQVSNKAHKGE